jgi:hypothetical protein
MKRRLAACLMLALCANSGFSQTSVNLCGTVKDENGNPLGRTVIRLSQATYANGYGQAPYIVETDAAGRYKIGNGDCATNIAAPKTVPLNGDAFSRPLYVGGKVLFSLPQATAAVRMSIYTVAGRFVRDVMSQNLSKGNYSVSINTRGISSQYYMLRVTISGASTVLRIRPSLRGADGAIVQSSSDIRTRLEKLAADPAAVDTLHATVPGYTIGVKPITSLSGQFDFTLTKNNTWNGDTAAFWGSGYPVATGGVTYVILNRTNGAFPDSQIYWDINGNERAPDKAHRLDKGSAITVPAGTGQRFFIYIAPFDSVQTGGHTPKYFDWVEQSIGPGAGAIYGNNLTRVDGWRLPIKFRIHTATADIDRGDLYELFYQPRKTIFEEFVNEVPKEFTALGTSDAANIYAPNLIERKGISLFNTGAPYVGYYDAYQDSVRAHNPTAPAKTTAWNIFACAGPIGSATWGGNYNRHVGTLPSSQWCDSSQFYKDFPCNYFSKWCHRRAEGGLQYGFAFDDDCNRFSGIVATNNVQWFAIAIGW